jgi:hypothetical protein
MCKKRYHNKEHSSKDNDYSFISHKRLMSAIVHVQTASVDCLKKSTWLTDTDVNNVFKRHNVRLASISIYSASGIGGGGTLEASIGLNSVLIQFPTDNPVGRGPFLLAVSTGSSG